MLDRLRRKILSLTRSLSEKIPLVVWAEHQTDPLPEQEYRGTCIAVDRQVLPPKR